MYSKNAIQNIILSNKFINFLKNINDFPNLNATEVSVNNFLKKKSSYFKGYVKDEIKNRYSDTLDFTKSKNKNWIYQETNKGIKNKRKLIFNGILRGIIAGREVELSVPILLHKCKKVTIYVGF